MSGPIDWAEVEAACFRSKLDRARPGDFERCQRAYETDPKQYADVSLRGRLAAMATVNPLATTPENGGTP